MYLKILNFNFKRILKQKFFWILFSFFLPIFIIFNIVILSFLDSTYYKSIVTLSIMGACIIGFIFLSFFNVWNLSSIFEIDKQNGIIDLELRIGSTLVSIFFARLSFNKIISFSWIILSFILNIIIINSMNLAISGWYSTSLSVGLFSQIIFDLAITSIILIIMFISNGKTSISISMFISTIACLFPVLGPLPFIKLNQYEFADKTLVFTSEKILNLKKEYPNGITNLLLEELSNKNDLYDFIAINNDPNVISAANEMENIYMNLIYSSGLFLDFENIYNLTMREDIWLKDVEIEKNNDFLQTDLYKILRIIEKYSPQNIGSYNESWFGQKKSYGLYKSQQLEDFRIILENEELIKELNEIQNINTNKNEINELMNIIEEAYKTNYYFTNYDITSKGNFKWNELKIESIQTISYGQRMFFVIMSDIADQLKTLTNDGDKHRLPVRDFMEFGISPFSNLMTLTLFSGNNSAQIDQIISYQSPMKIRDTTTFEVELYDNPQNNILVENIQSYPRTINTVILYIIDILIAIIALSISYLLFIWKVRK